jgi:transcriptional regulator with XRE-family HTH domain
MDETRHAPMDKRLRAEMFRQRLAEALGKAGLTRSGLADRIGVDRSTISQLLGASEPRLPNGHVVGEIAGTLNVSADWLLGLTTRPDTAADVLEVSLQIRDAARSPADNFMIEWHREVGSAKIRHVPTTLPDLMKTEAVLRFEYSHEVVKTADQAIGNMRDRLAFSREPESDLEICMPLRELQSFAFGQNYWEGLEAAARRAQLERMAALTDELYPSLRIYLFDMREVFSAPITIFGSSRAVIYVGQFYFVFNAVAQIRALTRHFDSLVRAAVVQDNEVARYIGRLAESV